MDITKHVVLYSPYSSTLFVDYKENNFGNDSKDDRKIVCLDGSCNLPETEILENGNIKLNGIRDYPISGTINVSGKFYWKIPVYDFRYVIYEEVSNLLGMVRLERKDILTKNELNELIKNNGWYKSNTDDDIIYRKYNRLIKKEKYIKEWNDSDHFMLNKSLKFYRKYTDGNKNLFGRCYNVKTLIIQPLDELDIEWDNLQLVANKISYNIDNGEENFNFDDPVCLEKIGHLGFMFRAAKETIRFQEFGLCGGKHRGYKVTFIDHKPCNISF